MDEIVWCGVCKGSKAKHHCKTENKDVCDGCLHFCHRMAHNWDEGELRNESTVEEGEASIPHR